VTHDSHPTRREFLTHTLAGAVGVSLAARKAAAQAPRSPPNIVFVLADDLGYADVGCYGRPELKTPNIDQLAHSGVRFLQGYANSAVCSATRLALITGRYQYRLRLGLEEPLAGKPQIGLPSDHPTLPSRLKKLGYRTALVGKWHLGAFPKFGPLASGYDHFHGFRGGAVDYFSHKNPEGRDDFWNDDVPIQTGGYMTELLGDRAVQLVNDLAKARQPFFLSVHFNAPHWPWEGPDDSAESKRITGKGLHDLDGGSLQTYRRMVEALDTQIGRVLRALRDRGLTSNTIVVFTSDNGGERFSDTWPFSGQKTELLEGGLRVPAIVAWPERLPQARDSAQVMISMDWMPTLLAAAGGAADPAYPLDGVNLLPHLVQGTAPVSRTLYWRYKANHQRAIRDGDYKFLKILDNTFLFNVVDDPLERANLKDRMPDVHRRLASSWQAWNRTMLPEVADSFGSGVEAATQADHIGARAAVLTPDEAD